MAQEMPLLKVIISGWHWEVGENALQWPPFYFVGHNLFLIRNFEKIIKPHETFIIWLQIAIANFAKNQKNNPFQSNLLFFKNVATVGR